MIDLGTDDLGRIEQGPHLSLEFPAAHAIGRRARAAVRSFAQGHGLVGDELATLEFVVGELIDNAIDHGGGAAREVADVQVGAQVRVSLRLEPQCWELQVVDRGNTDVDELREQVRRASSGKPGTLNERGRGLFLLAEMVTRLGIHSAPGGMGILVEVEQAHGAAS